MGFNKTFETVDDVITAIGDKMPENTILNDARYLELQEICEQVDMFVDSFDGIAIDVSADEDDDSVEIKIICPDVVIRDRNHAFYSFLHDIDGATFSKDGENLAICFIVTDVWIRVDE